MKMRKYFAMALVALGATAAFSSCQKDDKAYDAPKVEFRDANNAVIKEFNQASFGAKKEITVVVTLGDSKEVTLKKLEVSVVADGSTIKKPYTVSTIKGNAGDVKDKQVGTVKLDDLQIAEGDYAKSGLKIVAVATDSRAKETTVECVYKAKSGGETPKETPMQVGKEDAYINHIEGLGHGSYSFTEGKTKPKDAPAAERQLVNTSKATKGFVANFNSLAGFKFHKVEGDLKYDGATVEGVKKELGKATVVEINDLKAGNLFIATADVENGPFYLVEVTEVVDGKTTSYIDKTGKKVEGPAGTNGGYMKFRYKKSN